jgi:hypothetical membrane protein
MNSTMIASERRTFSQLLGRWLLVAGAVGSASFVCAWIVGGAVRPGYSPLHQAISDLAVGPNGLSYRVGGVLTALLKIGFAAGFAMVTAGSPRRSWRYAATTFLVIAGLGMVTTATFTDAPATVRIHSTATAIGALSRLLAMVSVGTVLLASKPLRGWGIYSLIAAAITLLLGIAEYAAFAPASPLAAAHIGGLMERIFVIELESWYVVMTVGLFRAGTRRATRATPEPRRQVAQ